MKRILSIVFLLSLLTIPALASSQQAYQDYLFRQDRYRAYYNEFAVAKNEYEKFKSLASETVALEKTKTMLSSRDELLRAYLLLLNEKLNENQGLNPGERGLYQALIASEVTFLVNHSLLVPSIGTIADAQKISDQLEDHYDVLARSIRQTIVSILLGNVTGVAAQFDQVSRDAQALFTQNRTTYSPQKQATLDRWLLQIANKRSLFGQKVDAIRSLNTQLKGDTNELDRTFASLTSQIAEAKQYLVEASSFLGEFMAALKYQE